MTYHPHHGFHGHYPHHYGSGHHAGLIGVFGGMINLSTASLQGGAKVVRNVVERILWHGCPDGGHFEHHGCGPDCHGRCHHCCCAEYVPRTYPCCCC